MLRDLDLDMERTGCDVGRAGLCGGVWFKGWKVGAGVRRAACSRIGAARISASSQLRDAVSDSHAGYHS